VRRIELIGASGVGKTTLYNKLGSIPRKNRCYLTLKDAYKTAALNCEIPVRQVQLFFYRQLLKSGMAKNKERGLGKIILMEHLNGETDQRSKYNAFSVSFDILYHYLKDEPGPFYVKKRMSRFLRTIDDYLLLDQGLSETEPVLVDEGMTTHHYPGITEYGFQTYSTEQLKSDPVFSPSGIIYCVQSPEIIFEQAIRRRENGTKTFSHGRLNNEELRRHIEKNILKDERKINSYRKIGVPVLEINTGEKFEHLKEKINAFATRVIS